MNINDGALSFDSYIENSHFRKSIDEMERRIVSLSDTTVSETGRMDSAFKSIGLAMGSYFTFEAATGLLHNIIDIRGEFQRYAAVLETRSVARNVRRKQWK